MTPAEYRTWMRTAFLGGESVLAAQLLRHRRYMSEETLRSAFVDAMMLSKPVLAPRIRVEQPAHWTDAECWFNNTHGKAKGRKIQHDVWVTPATDAGLACEVKWLKKPKADEVAKDVLKLAFARGISGENSALRTFLLVGGERPEAKPGKKRPRHAMTQTLDLMRLNGLDLRGSSQGGTPGPLPSARTSDLEAFVSNSWGEKRLHALLSWKSHLRAPPPCRKSVRANPLAIWQKTVEDHTWRLVLWEIDAVKCPGTLNWTARHAATTPTCMAPAGGGGVAIP